MGIAVVYGLRVNLSMAMVAMVNTTETIPGLNSSTVHMCPLPGDSDNTSQALEQPEGVKTEDQNQTVSSCSSSSLRPYNTNNNTYHDADMSRF